MLKNIHLAYWLTFFKNSWFWLGIWIFYYLRFTNYAGIGIIETVLITTMTLAEIPTGAVADLFGKRKTLLLSFLLQAIGSIIMGVAPNFSYLVFSVFVMAIGGAMYSGTLEALVYDTLKDNQQEAKYDRKIANINTIKLIAPAICGALGGFMYVFNPSLPFIAAGIFYFFGLIASFFLTEPKIDTEKFSWATYLQQTKQGIKQLTKSTDITHQTILLLSIGIVVVIADEMLNSFLGIEFGFKEQSIGIFWAILYFISALASQTIPKFRKIWGEKRAIIFVGGLIAISLLVSPVLGLISGGLILLLRSSLQSIYTGLASVEINNNTQSQYRATTLSTFNMLQNIPYVLCAYAVGSLTDQYSAKNSAFVLGVLLLVVLSLQILHTYKLKQLH